MRIPSLHVVGSSRKSVDDVSPTAPPGPDPCRPAVASRLRAAVQRPGCRPHRNVATGGTSAPCRRHRPAGDCVVIAGSGVVAPWRRHGWTSGARTSCPCRRGGDLCCSGAPGGRRARRSNTSPPRRPGPGGEARPAKRPDDSGSSRGVLSMIVIGGTRHRRSASAGDDCARRPVSSSITRELALTAAVRPPVRGVTGRGAPRRDCGCDRSFQSNLPRTRSRVPLAPIICSQIQGAAPVGGTRTWSRR